MRPVLVAPVALAVLVAGCIGGSSPEPAAVPAPPAAAPALGALHGMAFEGCLEQAGILPVPIEALARYVPEGFELETLDPAGQVGYVFTTSFTCAARSLGADGLPAGEATEVTEVHGTVAVIPPEEWALEDVFHGVSIGLGSTSAEHLAAYQAWSPGIRSADQVRLTLLSEEPARVMEVEGIFTDGVETFRGATRGPAGDAPAGMARIFLAAEGQAVGVLDVTWTEGQFQEGGPFVLTYQGSQDLPPPAYPGIALHWWGDAYSMTFEHKPLDALRAADDAGPAAPGRLGGVLQALRAGR